MIATAQLPELPLMLSELPRAVKSLLRESGIPAESLPKTPLLASGVGRFVLYDSKNARSSARARSAARYGLTPIDLRDFLAPGDDLASLSAENQSGWPMRSDSAPAKTCLEQLKAAVEGLGGVWVRLSDYPFPYQSAMCVAIEHPSDELADFASVVAMVPVPATHFVSSRLRADRLTHLSHAASTEVGWRILSGDCERSLRSTLSHWETRLARFSAANVRPVGLAIQDDSLPAPGAGRLQRLGFSFSCLESSTRACRVESCRAGAGDGVVWVRFSMRPLPPRELFVEWVGGHYQSGRPLFLTATTGRLDLVQELIRLSQDAGRCSLMWQTSFREFARWWAFRRQMRLQVWRTEAGYALQAVGEFRHWPPAVEIWRGSHLAVLPLRSSHLVVPDEGLVYLNCTSRNPAGCASPGGESFGTVPASGQPPRDSAFNRFRMRRKGSGE